MNLLRTPLILATAIGLALTALTSLAQSGPGGYPNLPCA